MKKISIFVLLALLQVNLAFALNASNAPVLDTPATPVDASKVYITGTSSAKAKIIVTGGEYEIAPVYADSSGKFSVLIALQQEKSNTYHIQAQETGKDPSDVVSVTIEESATKAAAYQALTGEDRTAPDAPVLEKSTASTSKSTYEILGSGEINSTVVISGAGTANGTVDSSGEFSVKVSLSGDNKADTFSVSLKDSWGNVSASAKITITGTGAEGSDDEVEEFTDVAGHWGEDYINKLHEKGIISGYSDGRFGPNDYVTRAQILKMALLAFEHTVTNDGDNFSDVMTDSWYIDYVSYAKKKAFIGGYSDGTFKPDNYVNRAEALKIIFKASGELMSDSSETNFPDVVASDWFTTYTVWAKSKGIIGGYSDGTFRGGQNITRAEVAKILSVMIE